MEEIEAKCPFYVCAGGIVHQYWAQQFFPYKDPQRKYIKIVCCDEKYAECGHYQIRDKTKGGGQNVNPV